MVEEIKVLDKKDTSIAKIELVLHGIISDARNNIDKFHSNDVAIIESINTIGIAQFAKQLYEINKALINGHTVFTITYLKESSLSYGNRYYGLYYIKDNKLHKLNLNNFYPLFKGVNHNKYGICFRNKYVDGEIKFDGIEYIRNVLVLSEGCKI